MLRALRSGRLTQIIQDNTTSVNALQLLTHSVEPCVEAGSWSPW